MERNKKTKFQVRSKRLLRCFVLRALESRKPLSRLIRETAELMGLSENLLYTRLNVAVWTLYNKGFLTSVVRKFSLERCPLLSEVVACFRSWEE